MSKLPSPYPCSPKFPGRYALYVTRRGDATTACIAVVFAAAYAARKFLDALLEGDGLVWEDDSTIRSETGVVVSTRWFPDRMREVVDHVYTAAEREWELDHTHAAHARRFRYGPDVRPTADGGVAETTRAPRPAPTPRASRDGLIPIADVAAELGVEPRDARAALRKLKIEKPAAGWAWTAAEVAAVRECIRGAL